MAQEFYVRIKPLDVRKKITTKRYHIAGQLFREDRGWYKIKDAALAAKLAEIRKFDNDEYSPLVFDVCDEAGARALDTKAEVKAGRNNVANAEESKPRRSVTSAREIRDQSAISMRDIKAEPKMLDPEPDGDPFAEIGDAGVEVSPDDGRVEEIGRMSGTKKSEAPAHAVRTRKAPAKKK